jgi:DNA-binding transcriptional regulator YdaS (Cro superfamily)
VPAVHSRTLEYAAVLVGGQEQLANRLGISRTELDLWMNGDGDMPLLAFVRVVDIVHEAAILRLSRKT